MSLEMIIGLVILLVVATVTVTMFLDIFDFEGDLGEQDITEIRSDCESKCQDYQQATGERAFREALDYCTATFVYDADESAIVQGEIYEQEYDSYCQDGLKCFNEHQCFRDGVGSQELDAEGCIEMMCEYIDRNEDRYDSDPGEMIGNHFYDSGEPGEGVGSCDLETVEVAGAEIDTWYGDLVVTDNGYEEICEDYIDID